MFQSFGRILVDSAILELPTAIKRNATADMAVCISAARASWSDFNNLSEGGRRVGRRDNSADGSKTLVAIVEEGICVNLAEVSTLS